MEVERIILFIGSAAALITALGVIIKTTERILQRIMHPLNKKIEKIDELQCKIFLINYLNDIEEGVEKDEVQQKLAHETFDHYSKDLHKNSYVKDRWQAVINKHG